MHRLGTGLVSLGLLMIVSGAFAQDKVYMHTSQTPIVGTITKVDNTHVHLKIPAGDTSLRRVDLRQVEINLPADASEGLKLVEDSKWTAAISKLEPIFSKYRGLPDERLEELTLRLGDAYIAEKQWVKATALFRDFQNFYSQSEAKDMATACLGRALFGQNQKKAAVELLEPLVAEKSKALSLPLEQNKAMGRAHLVLGRCYKESGNKERSLESFLKTIVLYYGDEKALAEAQYESALLYADMKQKDRAKALLEEVLGEHPDAPIAQDARKALESLN
jgi:tetratricopeptide (TPR) repeat protein